MNNKNVIVGLVFAVFLTVFIVVGLVSIGIGIANEKSDKQAAPVSQTLTKEDEALVQEEIITPKKQSGFENDVFKAGYLEGCDPDGTQTEYCECTYTELSNNYTLEEVIEMGEVYEKTGNLTDEMWDVAKKCI